MAEDKLNTPNPIDPDKIAENASLLPYGSSVSAPAFKAVDVLKNKSLDVNAMEMQTDMQHDRNQGADWSAHGTSQKTQNAEEPWVHTSTAGMGLQTPR